MSLKIYHQKRDFKKTPEPKGASKKTQAKKQKLFVIQKHAASHLHYDFRLELNGVLKSWAVPKGPSLDPAVKRLAMHVEDHPLEYGTFEGIIPKGQYGGGTVMLWDEGSWEPLDENPSKAYQAGNMTFNLFGEKLKGAWKLIRIKTNPKSWLLMKINDEYAKSSQEYDITIKKPNSVLNNESIDEIAKNYQQVWTEKGLEKPKKTKTPTNKTSAKKPKLKKKSLGSLLKHNLKTSTFPKTIYPELATLVDVPPSGEDWLHEIKFDGYRLLAVKKNNETRLLTRHNNDWTNAFKIVADAMNELPIKNVIVDGEVVLLNEKGQSNFQLLQNSIKENKNKAFIFYAFDLIYYDQYHLIDLPLIERKHLLQQLLMTADSNILRYSDHIIGSGDRVFENACKLGLEGIVSKNIDSPYIEKRTRQWLKVKCTKRQEFVIGGFTKPQGERKYFGSLLLGTYNKNNELEYNGNVGTGFTQASLKSIAQLLEKYKTSTMPFNQRPPGSSKVTWVKPKLVAEIEFSEWTQDNILRHPSFKGLRTDKKPEIITKEIPKTISSSIKKKEKKTINPIMFYPIQKNYYILKIRLLSMILPNITIIFKIMFFLM